MTLLARGRLRAWPPAPGSEASAAAEGGLTLPRPVGQAKAAF